MTTYAEVTLDATFDHHGVKGMHWGVRKDRNSLSNGFSKNLPNKVSSEKFNMGVSETQSLKTKISSGGLTPKQKQLLYAAVGTTAAIGLLGGAYYVHKTYGVGFPKPESLVDAQHYKDLVSASRVSHLVERGGIHPSSYKRDAFTIKAGETFHRISTTAETGFGSHTYASGDLDDFKRYLGYMNSVNPNSTSDLKHITFKAKSDIHVSDLKTNLETLREVMGPKTSSKEALTQYQSFMHTAFAEDSGLSKRFFKALTDKGFSAIVDEADAGIISNRPLIIFNNNNVSTKTSSSITENVTSTISEITNRKL